MARKPVAAATYQLRKQPKQARSKATVDAVLEAAARILVSDGYANASTNIIADTAGVSIGSLYEYFPGKEAIFAELRRREGMKAYARLVAEPRPTTPPEVMRHLVTSYIATYRDNLELLVALDDEVPRFAITDMEQSIHEDFIPLSDAFLEAHRSALRPTNDVSFLTEFLMRVIASTILDYAKFSPKHLETPELAETIIDMAGGWLLKDPS